MESLGLDRSGTYFARAVCACFDARESALDLAVSYRKFVEHDLIDMEFLDPVCRLVLVGLHDVEVSRLRLPNASLALLLAKLLKLLLKSVTVFGQAFLKVCGVGHMLLVYG